MRSGICLITGATGAVGPRVVHAFRNAGFLTRVLALHPPGRGTMPPEVEVRIGDITDRLAIRNAMRGVSLVVHMAALLHEGNPLPSFTGACERVNVDGTQTVTEAAVAGNVSRLVFFSTIAVYGETGSRIVDEKTQPAPDTVYARTKLLAERFVLEAKRSDGSPIGTVLRFAAVYGSQVKGNYRRLVLALKRRTFVPVGRGRNRRTLIYDRDAAAATVLAATHPAASGNVYNVSDGCFHAVEDIIKAICAALQRKPPRLVIPVTPVRLAAGVVEDISTAMGHHPRIRRSSVDKYLEQVTVSSHLIRTQLGFVPSYNLQQGWREAIIEMQLRGAL